MPMETSYNFRILPPEEKVSICIQQTSSSNESSEKRQKILNALFTGGKENLSDTILLRLFVSHPLMTIKVITAIHWEAARLWIKGLSLQPRNKNEPIYSLSWTDNNGVTHYETL